MDSLPECDQWNFGGKLKNTCIMHPCCFVCNARGGIAVHNEVNIFRDEIKLQSGKQLKDVLGEIFDKPINEETAHSKVICKKCHKSVTEYDSIQVRLKVIQLDMLKNFKATLNRRHIDYESYNKHTVVKSPLSDKGSERKKVVLPASKLQPVPPDFVLRPGNWFSAAASAASSKPIVTVPSSTSTLNLKVTVGSSVLTQSVKTTNAGNKIMLSTNTPKQNYILTQASNDESNTTNNEFSIDPNLLQMDSPIFTSSNPISYANNVSTVLTKTNSSILSFNVNSLPKDFLASGVLGKVNVDDLVTIEVDMKKEIDGNDLEAIDDQVMEIDEDCAVAVAANDKEDITFTKNNEQSESDKTKDFLETLLPGLNNESTNDDEIGNKYIVGKLEILNDRGDDDDEEGEAIVMNGENGSIIRIVSGQKFLYGDSEISIVMPEDSQDGENNDGGDGQDSNDESQIELQVSGDEETANAIIAAAQEQGGAFIKVESGEMYRVKSVQSKKTEQESPEVDTIASVNTMVSQEEDGQFKCLLCKNNKREGDPFVGSAEATMQHLKATHGARAYICPQCGRTLRKRCDLAAHIEEHAMKSQKGLHPADKSKAHECSVCSKKYSSRGLLMAHMNQHSGSKPYTCDICHKSFASKYTHQSHLKIHEERPRPYKCKQCNKTFFTQQNLNQHEKTHTGIKDFVCNVCGKAFASQHNLEVHGVVHSGSKPFKCGACGKAFARRAEVRDHMRIHTGERPFKCDICGASFTQRSNLHSHKRATHLDDKRYHCEQCPKRFKRRRLLDYHVKASHTGERPLKCEVCKSTFVYPEHYKKHVRIHSGEKPYVCEVCGKSFNSRDNRNTHRFVHSDRKPYECLVCGAGYMRKQQLYHHMNTSGHLVESIVVNQPRVLKVPAKNTESTQAMVVESASDKETEYTETIYETTGDVLQLQTDNVKAMESTDMDHTPKLFITEDKKLIIQDHQGAKSINFVQDNDEPALLTLQNIDPSLKTDGTLLETISAEQSEQAQLITSDGNGGTLRLVQIQLPDGNNGWLTINQ